MATTTNIGLTKPAGTDKALVSVINSNSDIIDSAAGGLMDAIAIVANGNTHAAISSGQYVYVHNHGTLAEGLYTANSAIAANATLTTSNLTADASGGLNALNSKIFSSPGDTTDFNSMTTTGLYVFGYNASGTSTYHRPENSAGVLMVNRINNSAFQQTYTVYSVPSVTYSRVYSNNAWSAWEQYALNSITTGGSSPVTYAKSSRTVTVSVNGAVTLDANNIIATIPSGYRPTTAIYFIASAGGSTDKYYLCAINTYGSVIVYPHGDTVSYAYGSCSYMTN